MGTNYLLSTTGWSQRDYSGEQLLPRIQEGWQPGSEGFLSQPFATTHFFFTMQCMAVYHVKQKQDLLSFRLVKTICTFGFWHTRTKEYKDNHYQYINFDSFHLSVSKTVAVNANKVSLLDIIYQVDSFCKKIHERMLKPLQRIINKRMNILSIYPCFYSTLMHCLLHVT